MITAASLKEYTCKDLAEMAKQRGIPGWHAMRKDQLIHALVRKAKRVAKSSGSASSKSARPAGRTEVKRNGTPAHSASTNGSAHRRAAAVPVKGKAMASATRPAPAAPRPTAPRPTAPSPTAPAARRPAAPARRIDVPATPAPPVAKKVAPAPPADPRVVRKIQRVHQAREEHKDLSTENMKPPVLAKGKYEPFKPIGKDRIVLMVRDPFWLHAYWELTSQSISRARAAMAEQWHVARPVLRIFEVLTGHTTATAERVVRDIPIHGGVQNWYIDVPDPPKGYRVEIGYLGDGGRFHSLARSNTVQTPRPGSSDAVDMNWADVKEDCERIFALSGGYDPDGSTGELQDVFEERFQRPMGGPLSSRFGGGAELSLGRTREFKLEVDAEMLIFGRTEPESHISLAGEPVKLRPDGTFSVRVHMPDRRQVLPIVSSSSDGLEQRTVVLAVERNTKVMEPVLRDNAND